MDTIEQWTPQQLADVLRADVRSEQTLAQTKPFLKQIDARVSEHVVPARKDIGISAPSGNMQFIDRAYFYLLAKQPTAFPVPSVYLLPNRLWWGIAAWGNEEIMNELASSLRQLGVVDEDEEPVIQKGSFTSAWTTGSYLLLGHEMTADEIERQPDITPILQTVAEDMVDYYQRLAPHVEAIDAELETIEHGNVWLFQANPQFFDLGGATDVRSIQVGQEETWTVTRYREEMRSGVPVVLWQSGERAGIYALARLTSEPYERQVEATEEEISKQPYLDSKWCVDLVYTDVLEQPIFKDQVKTHPVLANMQVIRMPQGTNFRLTDEEWSAIEELVQEQTGIEVSGTGSSSEDSSSPSDNRVVKIAPGRGAQFWGDCLANGYICVGWDDVGDLRSFESYEAFEARFRDCFAEKYNDHAPTIR